MWLAKVFVVLIGDGWVIGHNLGPERGNRASHHCEDGQELESA